VKDHIERQSGAAGEKGHLEALAHIAITRNEDILTDADVQLTLFMLYGLTYGSFQQMGDDHEWDVTLIQVRLLLEAAFERELRALVPPAAVPAANAAEVALALFALTAPSVEPSASKYIAKHATREQAREFIVQRTIYTLREADPHSWAIPRLTGAPKAALIEIQSDEYGGGRPDRMHSAMFAQTVRELGLDDTYGAYIDLVPAITLASHNLMSMFGINRRLRGAIVGHLAAYEMTSSIPSRYLGDGFRRLGYGTKVTAYFDEHVIADAVHEQIAGRDLAGGLAEAEPELTGDIMWGAQACLAVEGLVGQHLLDAWEQGRSSLTRAIPTTGAA
jgi:hypothetical protein